MTSKKYQYIVDQYDFSLLPKACEDGEIELVKLLLKNGAHPEKIYYEDKKALFYALERKNKEMIELLLNHGAKINCHVSLRFWSFQYAFNGLTPLMYAAFANYRSIIPFLIEKGANIDNIESNGKSILMNTIWSGCEFKTIELLLSLGADPHIPDKEGTTIRHHLCRQPVINWPLYYLIMKYIYVFDN